MLPFINILGKTIPMYAVMAFLGAAAMCGVSVLLARRRKTIPAEDIFYMLLYAGIGCLIGAKLLYIIVSVDTYWFPEKSFGENMHYWAAVLMSGGLVFYGGLIGAFLGALRYCIHFKVDFKESIRIVIPAIPLFHAFGRVGCFMAGCCHGIEYDGLLSVTYTNSPAAPNGVPLLPVQLFEATGNLALCVILVLLFVRSTMISLSGIYLSAYGAMRFALEFFRGDATRGRILIFSTSQWISLLVFTAGIGLIVYFAKKENSAVLK